MNWREAVQAMLDGKKVSALHEDWKEYYIWWPENSKDLRTPKDSTFFPIIDLWDWKWKIYVDSEPKILLTPEHVGRRVKIREGDIYLITGFKAKSEYPVISFDSSWKLNGQYDDEETRMLDIVEILE